MFSLNAPVPGRVRALASELSPELSAFDSLRREHTLLVKRLGDDEPYERLAARARQALAGAPAVEARITGIDYFAEPTRGPGPVVYLAVESPGVELLHRRLVEELGAVPDLEGEAYTSHVTLARGGDLADARRIAEREVDPVRWDVTELQFWDAHRERAMGRISLPA